MSDEAPGVYRASGRVRNGLAKRLLDSVLAEAPAGELARRSEPGPLGSHDEPGPLPLGRQSGDRLRGGLARDPVALETPANRFVALAPLGEGLRAAHRIALVVHEADALQAVERLLAEPGREPSLPKPQIELRGRLLPARNRSKRGVDGTSSAQLASELAHPRTVELLPHDEPDPDEHLGRDRAPACSVELDGDPAASKLAEPGDDRHYAGSLTFSGSLALAGSLAFAGSVTASVSTGAAPGSVIGRSRAETT